MATLSLEDAIRDGLKPTCDADGNWTVVPAAEIDGDLAIAATNLDETLLGAVAAALNVPSDAARVAVEGRQIERVQ